MAMATATDNTSPASPANSSPLSSPRSYQSKRLNSIDIHTANHLFQRTNRLSSRTVTNSNFDVSLDLTLSSGATFSSGGYTTASSDYQTSFSLNSHESTSSIGSRSTATGKWGNYSVKFRAKNFVAKRLAPLEAVYKIGELLGEGGYGEVYRCWHIASGAERAVKVLPKDELQQSDEEIIREFDILKECDHPNLLKVYECLEDSTNFYIVSDIIKGGELYDELDRCGTLSEEDAKVLMTVLLTCINYCHQRGLVHRDLKPENILLESNRDYHQLKIIDFGLAALTPDPVGLQQFAAGAVFTDMEGSKYYKSPQVLQGNYHNKCDIWSLGVIAFIMLGGYAPFDGETEEEVDQAVLEGQFEFDDEAWDFVGDEAKEFIMALLTYDEEARPSAEEALKLPWLQSMRDTSYQTDSRRRASTQTTLNDLQSFYSADSKLKQATCAIIASQLLSPQETQEIDEIFRSLDVSCNGALSRDDLKQSYQDYFQAQPGQQPGATTGTGGDHEHDIVATRRAGISDEELNELLKQVNFSGSGAIEYSEFVIATMMEKNMIDDDKLRAAFKFFDKEGKGFISAQNIKEVLQIDDSVVRGGDAYVTKKIIAQVDMDGNGVIDFDEFKNMMFSRNLKRLSASRASSGTTRRSSSLRRSSRNRISLTKRQQQQILEEERLEEEHSEHQDEQDDNHDDDDDDDEDEDRDRLGSLLLLPPQLSPNHSPASSRHGAVPIRPSVTETVPEESEEDCYSDDDDDDSATEEEYLFGPGDDQDGLIGNDEEQNEPPPLVAATTTATSPTSSPKRRKARSFCEQQSKEGELVDAAMMVSSSG